MESVYRQSFTLTDLHLDCFGRLKPSVMLYLIQEVSGAHATSLGAGWEILDEKNLFWAIIRHKIQIRRMPSSGETVTLETWPMPTTRTAFPRACVAYDQDGNVLFRSIALWVLMDRNTRAMVLPGKSGVSVPGLLRGLELDTPSSILPKQLHNHVLRTVGYTELDRNGHMNNTRYLDWIDDLLPGEFHRLHPMAQISICYLSEAREGQKIRLSWQQSGENTLSVEGQFEEENNHRVFAVTVDFA